MKVGLEGLSPGQVVLAHDPGDALVVHPFVGRSVVVELRGDPGCAVGPVLGLHGADPVGGLHLGDSDERHRPGRASGRGGGGGDAGGDLLERHARDHSRASAAEKGTPAEGQNSMRTPRSAIVALSSPVVETE